MRARPKPRGAVLLVALLCGLASLSSCWTSESEPPPSVLLIVVDTLRADHLGAYGYARPTSPHIDALAESGALFEHAQSASSWTLPSMASMLTGLSPTRHGCLADRNDAGAVASRNFRSLPADIPTLAEALAARGHATAAILTNNFMKPAFGLQRGFQHYEARFPVAATEAVDEVLAWFATHSGGSFFVLAHFMDPHLPYEAGAGFGGVFTKGLASELTLPVKGLKRIRQAAARLSARDRTFITAAYDEEIAYVDAEIGRLLASLRASGVLEHTFVVLTSDHGEELFDHQGFEHGHSMYQELLHVPLIVSGPGISSRRIEGPVSLTDLAATICTLADAPLGGLEGTSLAPLLLGQSSASRRPVSEGTLYGLDQSAILDWPRKLVVAPNESVAFDLARDPGEHSGLRTPSAIEGLRAELDRRQAEDRARRVAAPLAEIDSTVHGQLEDLGYVGEE